MLGTCIPFLNQLPIMKPLHRPPSTSIAAFESVKPYLSHQQETVYRVMLKCRRAMTHDAIITEVQRVVLSAPESGIRSRVSDLFKLGKVIECGTERNSRGRTVKLFKGVR